MFKKAIVFFGLISGISFLLSMNLTKIDGEELEVAKAISDILEESTQQKIRLAAFLLENDKKEEDTNKIAKL